MWQGRFSDRDWLGHGNHSWLVWSCGSGVASTRGPVAIPLSKSQMLATLNPCEPGCPMSFTPVLITPGYNWQVLENAVLLVRRFKKSQENQL
jgi:hypothetical protein